MSYPFWISPSALGTFSITHSFTQTPLVLDFGESANLPCVVSLLNGNLPPGVEFTQSWFSVIIQGVSDTLLASTEFEFTLRASNGTYVADRTFNLEITVPPTPVVFEWITNSSQPLGTVYNGGEFKFQVQALVIPLQPIFFYLNNIEYLTQGISINSYSGTITIDLSWKPNTLYSPENLPKQPDYVFNNDILYKCVQLGTSGSSFGPLGTGPNIPDTDYPAWQPNSYYDPNSVVTNDLGKLYKCINYGFSSNSLPGPTGTGSNISDGDILWNYFDQAPLWDSVSIIPPALPIGLLDQTSNFLFALLPNLQFVSNFYQINLLTLPVGPVWLTPNDVPLVTLANGSEFSYQLDALDPDGQALVWSVVASPPNVQVSNVGLLYGMLPITTSTTSFTITVNISDTLTNVPRDFTVIATYTLQVLYWNSPADLGLSKDGAISNKLVQATSLRSSIFVSYGLSGGMIPPGIILNQQSGMLEGFIEFHPQSKTYWFEITASDGTQDIIQLFSWNIVAQNLGLHWNLSVPILGNQRFNLLSLNNSSIIDENQLYLGNSKGWGRTQILDIPIISGIKRVDQSNLKNLLSNYLHNFRLRLNYFTVSNYLDSAFQVVSVAVQDADTVEPWQPQFTYYQNKRVTGPDGNRYVALSGGKSGSLPPRGTGTSIKDGSITWSFDSIPNPVAGYSWALPWYPYHYYLTGQTVVNNGNRYISLSTGYTSGGPGPLDTYGNIQDNQVTWQWTSGAYADNLFWPADIYNIRKFCKDYVGFSTGWGQDAMLIAVVDKLSQRISSINVTDPGYGYYNPPVLNVTGSGQGAKLVANIGIISVTLIYSSSGFSVGDQIIIDLGSDQPATIEIVSVTIGGIANSVIINNPGQFLRVPSENVTLFLDNNYIVVRLDAGIISVNVLNAGQGYSSENTIISNQGQEIDILAQQLETEFNLELPIGFVEDTYADDLRKYLFTADNPFIGTIIPATLIKATLTGIQWQGHTRFDQNECVFDGDQTRFVEFTPATETTFDNNTTYYDNFHTTFDDNWITQWPDWSQTVFESGHTIFNYYRTMFDQRSAEFESRYSQSKFWYFGQPFDV